jgi:DNA adenine methylase
MTYPGGKNGEGVWQTIINQMPPHRVYVELFLGSGAVLRRKRPAEGNVGVDIDPITCAAVQRLLPTRYRVINCDALAWLSDFHLKHAAAEDVLIYADPPYLMETRSSQRDIYRHEFNTYGEHSALLCLLATCPAKVILSGYASSLYEMSTISKWRRLDFTAGSRRGPRTESLWMNFPAPAALHDYRFIGKDRTDRQRIRRKIARWQSRLAAMPALERGALSQAIAVGDDSRRPQT